LPRLLLLLLLLLELSFPWVKEGVVAEEDEA